MLYLKVTTNEHTKRDSFARVPRRTLVVHAMFPPFLTPLTCLHPWVMEEKNTAGTRAHYRAEDMDVQCKGKGDIYQSTSQGLRPHTPAYPLLLLRQAGGVAPTDFMGEHV